MKKIAINQRVKVLDVENNDDITVGHVQDAIKQGLPFFATWKQYILNKMYKRATLKCNKDIFNNMVNRLIVQGSYMTLPNAMFIVSDEEYVELSKAIDQQPDIIKYRFDNMIEQYNQPVQED